MQTILLFICEDGTAWLAVNAVIGFWFILPVHGAVLTFVPQARATQTQYTILGHCSSFGVGAIDLPSSRIDSCSCVVLLAYTKARPSYSLVTAVVLFNRETVCTCF